MVAFNSQDQNPGQVQDWSNGGRFRPGFDYSDVFAGLGKAVSGVANTIDQYNKTSIDKVAEENYDAANAEFGQNFAALQATPGQDGAPSSPAFQAALDKVKTLKGAANAGKLTGLDYTARMDTLVKSLRSQFPGYRDYIDEKVSSLVGYTPANRLRAEQQALLQEAQSSANTLENQKWEAVKGIAAQGVFLDQDTVSKKSLEELRAMEAGLTAKHAGFKFQQEALAAARAADKDTADQADNVLLQWSEKKAQNIFDTAVTSLDGKGVTFNQLLQNAMADGDVNPQETAQIVNALQQLRNTAMVDFATEYTKDIYRRHTAQGLEAARTNLDKTLEGIQQSVENNKWGALALTKTMTEAAQNSTVKALQESLPISEVIAAANQMDPTGLLAQKLTQDVPGVTSSLVNQAKGVAAAVAMLKPGQSASQILQQYVQATKGANPGDVGAGANSMFDNWIQGIMVAPEGKGVGQIDNQVNMTYGDTTMLQAFARHSTPDLYLRLTDPTITQKVMKTASPEMRDKYRDFAVANFPGVFKTQWDSLQSAIDRNAVVLGFDPAKGQITVEPKAVPQNTRGPRGVGNAQDLIPPVGREAAKQIAKINQAIANLKPINDAYNGKLDDMLRPAFLAAGIPEEKLKEIFDNATPENNPDKQTKDKQSSNLEFDPEALKKLAESPVGPKLAALNDPEFSNSVVASANELGINPVDLGTVMAYETGGDFNPDKMGGTGGNYQGLIQFGPEERKQFGVRPGMSRAEQMKSVVAYLKARGLKPGSSILDLYSTILTGSPGNYTRADQNGTVLEHVANMLSGRYRQLGEQVAGL